MKKPTKEQINKARADITVMMDKFNKNNENLFGESREVAWKKEVDKIYQKHGILEFFKAQRANFKKNS